MGQITAGVGTCKKNAEVENLVTFGKCEMTNVALFFGILKNILFHQLTLCKFRGNYSSGF